MCEKSQEGFDVEPCSDINWFFKGFWLLCGEQTAGREECRQGGMLAGGAKYGGGHY